MRHEDGHKMTEKEILKESMYLMTEVNCLLFETTTDNGIAAAWMADSLIKYLQVIYHGDDVLLAAAEYKEYEEKIYQKFMQEKRRRNKKK
jgi:hypothetical protein